MSESLNADVQVRKTPHAALLGAGCGYLILHPLFMLLVLGEPVARGTNRTAEGWLEPIVQSFKVEMFPMALAFAAVGAAVAIGSRRKLKRCATTRTADSPVPDCTVREGGPERVRSQAARFLAHDLKNGLGAIVGCVDVLLRREDLASERGSRATLTRLRAKSLEMIAHTRNFLDHELLGDRSAATRASVHVRELLESAAHHDVPNACSSIVEIEPISTPGLRVRADPLIIGRVLENLVSNAVRHNPTSIHIRLAAVRTPCGTEVVFTCTDDGTGIPADVRDRLFEEHPGVGSGSGLGLAFCRHAVQDHGGRIWFEVPHSGSGARFCFTLPRLVEE